MKSWRPDTVTWISCSTSIVKTDGDCLLKSPVSSESHASATRSFWHAKGSLTEQRDLPGTYCMHSTCWNASQSFWHRSGIHSALQPIFSKCYGDDDDGGSCPFSPVFPNLVLVPWILRSDIHKRSEGHQVKEDCLLLFLKHESAFRWYFPKLLVRTEMHLMANCHLWEISHHLLRCNAEVSFHFLMGLNSHT